MLFSFKFDLISRYIFHFSEFFKYFFSIIKFLFQSECIQFFIEPQTQGYI